MKARMKKFGSLLSAAILGSLITVGSFQYLEIGNQGKLTIEHIDGTPSRGTRYPAGNGGELANLDFTSAAKKVTPAVVNIRSTISQPRGNTSYRNLPDPFRDFFGDEFNRRFFNPNQDGQNFQPQIGTGSGVIINSQGYIVTNNHVIDKADDLEVTLNDNRSYKAKVIGTDPTTDLALIKIDETGLPTLPFVNSDEVQIGEWVMAVGNPFNLTSTVTAGIVSAKGRSINILQDRYAIESFIQTDAAINPGNSGGALVDLNGGLVGINTAIASTTGSYSGYGFAVPSNMVSKVVEDLLKYGTVQRGLLGITIRSVTSSLAKEKDLNLATGVYVDSVSENSGARIAGILPGDVIIEVDGNTVQTSPELMELVARKRPGDVVNLKINRNGKERKMDVLLKNREGTTAVVSKENLNILTTLGAEFVTIDKKIATQLNIKGGVQVKEIFAGKLAQNTEVRKGFIITKINETEVTNVEQFKDLLESGKGGILIEGIYPDSNGKYYYALGL